MASVQHSFGTTMAAEVSYLRTDGRDFPLQRQLTQPIYELPGINEGHGLLNGALAAGNSRASRSSAPACVAVQPPSGIDRSRPDIVAGVDPV